MKITHLKSCLLYTTGNFLYQIDCHIRLLNLFPTKLVSASSLPGGSMNVNVLPWSDRFVTFVKITHLKSCCHIFVLTLSVTFICLAFSQLSWCRRTVLQDAVWMSVFKMEGLPIWRPKLSKYNTTRIDWLSDWNLTNCQTFTKDSRDQQLYVLSESWKKIAIIDSYPSTDQPWQARLNLEDWTVRLL